MENIINFNQWLLLKPWQRYCENNSNFQPIPCSILIAPSQVSSKKIFDQIERKENVYLDWDQLFPIQDRTNWLYYHPMKKQSVVVQFLRFEEFLTFLDQIL